MKKSKFSEEQTAFGLREVEGGRPVADVCRQLGISEATFYVWKKKFGHLGVSEVRRLRQVEDENGRLKRLVADLTLDKHMLAEALRKKSEAHTPPRAGPMVPGNLRRQLRAGLSGGAVQSRGVVPQKQAQEQTALRLRIREIAHGGLASASSASGSCCDAKAGPSIGSACNACIALKGCRSACASVGASTWRYIADQRPSRVG